MVVSRHDNEAEKCVIALECSAVCNELRLYSPFDIYRIQTEAHVQKPRGGSFWNALLQTQNQK